MTVLSNIITPSNVLTTTNTATVTNKTLTSPTITGTGTIAAATLSLTSTLSATGAGSIEGLTVGKGAGAVSTNTAVGNGALNANVSGGSNAAVGYQALLVNTGSNNTAFGASVLTGNTSGVQNSALGTGALFANTTGGASVAVGYSSLIANTTGNYNTAIGTNALNSNTTASYSVAVGYQSAYTLTTGNAITAVGYRAGYTYNNATDVFGSAFFGLGAGYLTTGRDNSFIGAQSGYNNSSGSFNTAVGSAALQQNTTASLNTAVGYQALYSNTTGPYNTAIGYQAGYASAGAQSQFNTFVGWKAGYNANPTSASAYGNMCIGAGTGQSLTTGYGNTFVGAVGSGGSDAAGTALTTGINNSFIGTSAGNTMTTGSKNTILGRYDGNYGGLDIRTSSNYIVLSDGDGNPRAGYHVSYGGFFINRESAGTYSQLNYLIDGVQKAAMWWDNALSRLATYTNAAGPYVANGGTSWTSSSDERLKNITGEIQNGLAKVCTLRAAEYTWKLDTESKPQVGLIAQDVLAVLPEAVQVPPEGAIEKDGSPAMMGVQYTDLIPLLVAAIKELKAEFDAYKLTHP